MKVSDIVNNKIDRLRTGYIFTYDDFDIPVDKVDALKKVLSRLVASGKIARLSKVSFINRKEVNLVFYVHRNIRLLKICLKKIIRLLDI